MTIANESTHSLDETEGAQIHILSYLLRGAAAAIPGRSPSAIFRRIKLMAVWLWNFKVLRAWHAMATNNYLPREAGQHPLAMGVALWPYIHAGWDFSRRVEVISKHYHQLASFASKLAVPVHGSFVLAKLDDIRPGLSLIIDRAQWFLREGELVINIFLGKKRIFSIAFALGKDDSEDVIIIGGIQGVREENIVELYKNLTKELHGIRPRDLIVIALKMIGSAIGFKRILAISDASRQHRNSYFKLNKKEDLILNYDEIWTEHGAVLKDSGFYVLATEVNYRSEDLIPSRKRAMYRRRYNFLRLLELDIKKVFEKSSTG